MGTSRSAFEARSIFVASSVRPLYFRLRWGWEGNHALGVCGWGGVANERKGRSCKHLRTKPEAQVKRAVSITLKTFPPNAPVSLSRVTAHSKAHAAAGTRTCANECGLHEGSPTSPRHSPLSTPVGLNMHLRTAHMHSDHLHAKAPSPPEKLPRPRSSLEV